jgi:hypothetical protein
VQIWDIVEGLDLKPDGDKTTHNADLPTIEEEQVDLQDHETHIGSPEDTSETMECLLHDSPEKVQEGVDDLLGIGATGLMWTQRKCPEWLNSVRKS